MGCENSKAVNIEELPEKSQGKGILIWLANPKHNWLKIVLLYFMSLFSDYIVKAQN